MAAPKQPKGVKIPKGFKPVYTTYELTTKTTYDKPYKPLKVSSGSSKPKPYVQPVRIVGGLLKPKRAKKASR